jgi:SecD/SecF fusion protein
MDLYRNYWWKFPFIAVIVAGCLAAFVLVGPRLGLDLQGGSELTYQLDISKIPVRLRGAALTDEAIEIMKKRLDIMGLAGITPRRSGNYEIIIQLPGVDEKFKSHIKRAIRTSGKLVFKIVAEKQHEKANVIKAVQQIKAEGKYDPTREIKPEDPEEEKKRIRLMQQYDVATDRKVGPMLLENVDQISGALLESAYKTVDNMGKPAIGFTWRPEGRSRFGEITRKNVGRHLAIVLDGVIQSAPRIKGPIPGGRGIIEGRFTPEEIQALVTVLKSGSLPAKPILISENSVGPGLGKESIRTGTQAIVIGLLIVLVFMGTYYLGSGLVADLALCLNLVIVVGVLSIFNATLTLPGIAGLILTVGMSVDANILIFERIREEMAKGVPLRQSVVNGYSRAFWTIFDANITTFFTALILYYFGTSVIKGFAITLMFGILASMFTALFVTKAIFALLIDRGVIKTFKMFQIVKEPNFPFIARRVFFIGLSLVLINLGLFAFLVRGKDKYGIDFTGGNLVEIRFKKPIKKSEIEAKIRSLAKKGKSGTSYYPYQETEVQRIIEPGEDPGSLEGIRFQIRARDIELEPSLLREASAAETDSEETLETPRSREVFVADLKELFGPNLAPDSFPAHKVIPPKEEGGKGTLQFFTNVKVGKGPPKPETVEKELAEGGFQDAKVQVLKGETPLFCKLQVTAPLPGLTPEDVNARTTSFKEFFKDHYDVSDPLPRISTIGSSVAYNLKSRAFISIFFSLIVIVIYITFRFEFRFGLAAIVALAHDVLITMGAMALLDLTSPWTGIDAKINLPTLAAFLTIIGYSLNDTIVVFDRIRENLTAKKQSKDFDYKEVINKSINQTLARTLLTSLTTLVVVVVLFLCGVKAIQSFSVALIIGILVGTYSSIFIASPILVAKPWRAFLTMAVEACIIAAMLVANALGYIGGA